jgi:Protein of unknown function (DUF732)
MKKIVIAVSVLAAGLALGFAPIASATEDEFVATLAAAGITGPSAAAAGYTVCSAIATGTPEATIVTSIENPGNGITPQDAQLIYDAANAHLCAG